MSILGKWNAENIVPIKGHAVVIQNDLIEITELASVDGQRKARFTCIRSGVVKFSGTLDLDAPGKHVYGAFYDAGDYKVDATVTEGDQIIRANTWCKISADENGGLWDGNR